MLPPWFVVGGRRSLVAVAKSKNKVPFFIRILISAVLLFGFWQSLQVPLLYFGGETTVGTLTSYSNRRDDAKAEQNRSRTVFKGYRFSDSGQEYKGYVIYKSDECWPDLGEDEVRPELITYLPTLPQINKPTMLVDFGELGPMGLFYHAFALPVCAFLFLLTNGWLPRRRKNKLGKKSKIEKEEKEGSPIYCQKCGNKIKAGAAFCSKCGAPQQNKKAAATCASCGADLPAKTAFCINCGGAVAATGGGAVKKPAAKEKVALKGRVGWSPNSSHPEIREAARKGKKTAITWAGALTVFFPVGFLLAGLFIDEMPLKEAIIIGVGLGLLMLIINLMRIGGMSRSIWEGVVIQKYQKDVQRHRDDITDTYTEFTTVIRRDRGGKRKIVERDRQMYDYLAAGDQVRYYPAFESYEKYDKSKDSIIYCNVCRMMNRITNERCQRCHNLLFK